MNKRKMIGAILGIILYGVCIVFFTYAYYNWKSDNTTVGLNITDTSLEVEFEKGPDVNALNIGPVLDYNDGESTTFKIKNPTENPIRMNVSLDIATISDNLKNKDFKYKLLVDRTGETNFIEEVTEGNFLNFITGRNELLLASVVPGNSTYNYKFIVYIDGNVQNNNNLQENTLESNLIITENCTVMITFDSNGGTSDVTEKEVNIGETYGELPTPTRTGYTFNGWYTGASGGTKVTSSSSVEITSNQTLYASWTLKNTAVTYYRNTSTSDTATASQTFTYGATGNKFGYNTDGTPTWTQSGQFGQWDRTGYTLLGWSDERTATANKWNIYSDVNDSWIDTYYPSVNLYAIWEKITQQTGTEYFVWSGTSDGQATFTFPKEFAAKPKVTYTIKWDNGPHHNVWILSTSTTGWTLYGDHIGERGTYSRFRVNWTATLE